MKTHRTLLALSVSLLASTLTTKAQLGGDPTTPPSGPPTRTMKTLDQVEARIPLVEGAPGVTLETNGGFTITQSGSYYLVGNLDVSLDGDCIDIDADNVTLDLNGFTISKSNDVGNGIRIDSNDNIHITNGFLVSPYTVSGGDVTGNGFDYAIFAPSNSDGISISELTIVGPSNGVMLVAIDSSESCVVRFSGGNGIMAELVRDCNVSSIELDAITADVVLNSYAHSFQGVGISASEGSVHNSKGKSEATSSSAHGIYAKIVSNSQGEAVAGSGIKVLLGSVTNSSGFSDSGDGIGSDLSVVTSCYGLSSTGIGIDSTGAVSYSRGAFSSGNGIAIQAPIVVASNVSAGDTIDSPEKHLGTP